MAGHNEEVVAWDRSVEAWNMDGSSDAQTSSGSWIRHAEDATGRRRGRCSFDGCPNRAEVGGHVWVSGEGCFIAPICGSCNWHNNPKRQQGAGARLRAHVAVTTTPLTEGMRKANRRYASSRGPKRRQCASCAADITDRPADHSLCYSCWSTPKRGRSCEGCGRSIAGSPAHHYLCRRCF